MIVWTVNQACAEGNFSRTTLYKLIAAGRVIPRKVGSRTYIHPVEIRQLFGLSADGAADSVTASVDGGSNEN